MSLRAKIALGVVAATAFLAVALALLGLEAKSELDAEAERQREAHQAKLQELNERAQQRMDEQAREYHELAVRSIRDLVLAWTRERIRWNVLDIRDALRAEDNGFSETAILELEDTRVSGTVYKPENSELDPSDEEERVIREVFRTGRHRFHGDILYHPYNPDGKEEIPYVLSLRVNIPAIPRPAPLALPQLGEPPSADLGPLVVGAFTTLALAMLVVFVLLMFALRKFVLAPLGDVLEDSERIVKGAEGLEVKGFQGGKGKDIETLVAAFNAMFKELKAYQSDLEGKVSDATRTIRKQQQSLVIAQRLASTGTLAAGLAHEVNNPLSGMLNAARRLKKRDLDERSRDYVELIEEGLGRIERLMKQILDFSRRRDMKPERFPPAEAFRRALQLVRHRIDKKELRMEEDIRKDLPDIYGNAEEIGQVLMNLLINAADASPEGTAIRVSIRPSESGGVVFTVEDSGEGVPSDIRPRIFDPFFTTKEPGQGTGLGLAIAHTIIDNHGGAVNVEQGQTLGGARFVVELPRAEVSESRRISEVE